MSAQKHLKPGELCWIAADWGTSNLRVWALDRDGNILDRAQSDKGMGKVEPGGFSDVLSDLVAPWLTDITGKDPVSVIICGMAGAKQGWKEAPYCTVPARPDALAKGAVLPQCSDRRLVVRILPGLKQVEDPDVMRGEETQLVGLMAAQPDFVGWVSLPGTHSKWARIEAGQITGFRTYMSGEVYALLSGQSVLRHSMEGDWDEEAFAEAITVARQSPGDFLHRLFTVRASGLVEDGANTPLGQTGGASLSGYVIGAEIADILGRLGEGEKIALVGEGKLADLYQRALAIHGIAARTVDAEEVTLGGLRKAHAQLG